ncbi:MAG: DUF4388 domain-containing protein [Planctomycetota bacterium]|jgi:hypothetical protein
MLGSFHSDILNNLFLYLSNNRQNGILGVTTGPLTKGIFFKKGNIVFSGSTDARERIGNVLLKLGYITEEQIAQVTRICCSLVNFPVGTYFFLPNCVPVDSFNHFAIEPHKVLFEGVLRMDEKHHAIGYDPDKRDDRSPLEVLAAMEEGD